MLCGVQGIGLFGPEGRITPLTLDSRIICLLGSKTMAHIFTPSSWVFQVFFHWTSLFHRSGVHQATHRAVPFSGVGLHQRGVLPWGRVQSYIYFRLEKKLFRLCWPIYAVSRSCFLPGLGAELRTSERGKHWVYCRKAYGPFWYEWQIWSQESPSALLGCLL